MRIGDILRLLSLAAIWGASFIFFRVLAPVLGPLLTTNLRILIAGSVLSLYFLMTGFDCEWKKNWKHYLLMGIVNSAIPFSLFTYAALYLPASYEVILNSTAPLFGVIFSWIWLDEKMSMEKISGLFLAAFGVGLIVNLGGADVGVNFFTSVAACLLATTCYALSSIYIKKFASHVKPRAFAGCSQLLAGIALIPFTLSQPAPGEITTVIILNVLGLSLICSAVAYLLYYRLISDLGPTKALSVTFLMPVFGMIWGAIFLNEVITIQMILGTAFILSGTWFVMNIKK